MNLAFLERSGMARHTVGMTNPKRPRDRNQLAKLIADIAVGEITDTNPDAPKDPVAMARGRIGGKIGGKNRMAALSDRQKSEMGRRAAEIRWKKRAPSQDGALGKGQLNKTS